MKLDLKVEHSVDIKRKKPWPKIKWLGEKCEDVFVLDGQRASTLFLKNGETRKKIPKLQPQLDSATVVATSRNGAFLVGLQKKGNLFLWHKDNDVLRHITGVPDILSSTLVTAADKEDKAATTKPSLFVSADACQVLLVVGNSNLYLWEMKNKASLFHSKDPNLQGKWSHISAGDTRLPLPTSKDVVIDAVFFTDLVLGKCCSCSFVFNFGSSIQISAVLLRWLNQSNIFSSREPTYSAEWTSLRTPLSSLGSSCSAMLHSGAFVARHTNDGSTLAIAINQQVPQNTKMMFVSTMTSTAVVSDMKSCGCKTKNPPTQLARSYRVGSMEWTINSLFLVCITMRGSVCIFSRLGELLVLQAEGCSVELGPAYFLPFHPVITIRTMNNEDGNGNSDSSESDPMKQRFSVTTHPSQPLILCSDGYLVTVLSLPAHLTCEATIEQYLIEGHDTLSKLNDQWQLGLTIKPIVFTKIVKPKAAEMLVSPNQNNSHPFPSLKRSAFFGFRKAETLNLTADVIDGREKSALTASSDFSDYGKPFDSMNEGKIMFGTMDSIDGKVETTTDFNELLVLVKKAHRAILSAWGLGVSVTDKWSLQLESLMQHTAHLISLLIQVLMKCNGNLLRTDSTNLLKNNFSKFAKRYPRIFRVLLLFKCTMTLLHWDTLHKNLLPHMLKLIHEVIQHLLTSNSGRNKHVKAFACLYRLLHYSEFQINSIYSYASVVQPSFDFAHLERKFYESDVMESAVFQNITSHQDVDKAVPVARLKAIATIQEILDQTKSLRGSLTRSLWHPGTKVASRHLPAKRLMMSWKLLHQKLTSFYCELSFQAKQTPQDDKVQKQIEKLHILLAFTQTSLAKLGCSIPVIFNKRRSQPRRKIFLKGCESFMFAKQACALDFWRTSYIRTQAVNLDNRKQISLLRHSIASDSLLAILYTHILNFDLVSAIEMIDSLVECYSLEEHSVKEKVPKLRRACVSFLFALMGGKQDDETTSPPVLPCVIEPAAKIAVATLARFMAMYFSNQSLFVYPPYNPQPLPRLDSPDKNIDNRRIAVYHDQISVAIRKSDLSDIFTVNLTLQLLLVCGLHWEAIWFAKQLGDWKSSLVLAVIANEHNALHKKMVKNTALPKDLHPLSIVKENLMHVIQQSQYTAPQQQNVSNNHKAQFKSFPSRLLTSVKKSLSIASLTEADKALHEQLSRSIKEILTAATVAKLDVTPWLLCQLMQKCLAMVAKFDRLVPDDFYLPAPPYFCPQPSLGIEVTFCEAVQDEYELRRETSDIIQLILLVLSASNCTMPCSRWYVQELMKAQEKLVDQDQDTTCDFPTMLASYTACPVDFKALLVTSDPTRHSTKLLLQCFRDVCTIVWLLNVRDKLTMAVRKYHGIQENVCSSLNTSPTLQQKSTRSVLQDIIQWSKFLHSFSFFLNMEDEVQDILLTAVSNLPPSKDVAEVLGEVFYSSKIVLPAVEEKFQRVMTKLKKKKEKADESAEKKKDCKSTLTLEPLYVYYRKQCLKQKRSMISKMKILGSVEEQILGIYCSPPKSKETIEKQLSKASTFKVGARSFETNKVFLDFLETFFLVAFGKFDESVSYHGIKRTDNIPLLRSYADEIRQHELSTLAFGIAKPQHCVELCDAVLLRSQSFENLSKSFSLTRSGTHETEGCVPSKGKGLFRSKQSYLFKKKMLPSIELLSTLNYKGAEQEVVDDLEKNERPVSRLSQKFSLGHQKNQSFDDIRAVSRMSSLSSSRVSRSSLAKLRSSKGSLMLGLDGQKLFVDVNVVPGAVYNEMVLVQQWMSRWSKKRLPFDTHSSSETTERAIRVELPQQLLVNCMWLIENWYSLEKSKSTDGTSVDDVDGIDQGKKNRRLGVALRPNLNKENSNVEAKDKMSKSKVTMKKRSKSSQSLVVRSHNIEAELKKPDGEDQETKSRISKNKKKRKKYKKMSKTSEIHSVTSQSSEDAFKHKQKEKDVQEIVEKKLKRSGSDSDEINEEKIKKSSYLRKQHTQEISSETSLKLQEDEKTTTAMNLRNIQQDKGDTDQHNILYRRSPVTGAVQTLTSTHYYHSGEDSDSSTTSLTEKDVAKSVTETDLYQLNALERKHSIPQSPLVSPCASINRQHSDQTIGFRKLVRAELKKLLEAQHKNTMTMLDTSGSYSGDAHPLLLAYNDSNHTKGIDEEKSNTLQRIKHPSGRVYSTSGRSVKAVLARRTTIPSLSSSPSSPESPSEVNKRPDVSTKPSSKTSSKLFLNRNQSSEKNRTFSSSPSTSPSGNRNQNAGHSPEELDDQRDFPLNDEVFSWMVTSDESDKEPQYQRDSLGRPLPDSGFRNPSFQDDVSFNQHRDIKEVSSPLNIEDLKNQEVETLQDVEQVDIQQNDSVEQNEVQGWPLLSFINSDSIAGKSFPEFEGHQHPKIIPTQPHQIPSQPFWLGQPLTDKLPPVTPRSAWHHQNIHRDPDISNEYVAGFPLLKLKQDSGHAPGLHPVQQQGLQNNELIFNFAPRDDKDVYSSIWIPPLLHLDRPSGYYQGNANDFPHNIQNVKDMSRPVESDNQSDYDSIWVPPLLHLDKQAKDKHESYISKHLQHFWAKEKNIHSLKLRLRGKHPHEVDPVQHIDNKEDQPDKVSMPLLKIQPKADSDESHTRRRRRQHHRVSSKDEDSSSQKSSSSCRSDTKIQPQPKQNAKKPNRRKLPKEPSKRPKESKKATKHEEKKEILIPFVKDETPRSTDITISPSEESESQPEDVVNKVKSQRNLHEKGSYDHLLEGRQESYFPSSAEVHLKAVRGIQPKQVERVDAATMATEMKNAQTSIDFDKLVKLPEDDENTLILDQDGKAINDAISAYTTAKTGLDNAGKILAPDIFFNLRFERTSENQATIRSPDTEDSPSGRNFISVVDLEGSRLLDDIPISKQPAPEIIQHPRSQSPSIASVHYSALRNREKEPNLTSPREVPEVDSPTGPDPLTKELLAARKRINKEQFSKIKAISDEEREGYKKRMNIQLMEMDEQLKVIDEMSKQMEEDLQGTNKLMKNVETISDFLTPQQPQKKVRILDAFSDKEKKEKQDDKQRIQPLPENKQDDQPKMPRLPDDEEVDMPGMLPKDKEPTVEENHGKGQEWNVTSQDEKKKDDLAISRIDTTLDDTRNTLGISGISGVSDIIAEVIVDGDLNATALGISKEQRKAARRRMQRQQIKVDEEMEDLDFTSLDSKQIRELLKTPREEDDEKEPWPSAVQPSKRTEQQQKELKLWTKKKREKAIVDYRNKLGDLREMEKTPFKAKNTSTLKELQEAEVERQNKRKTKEEEDYDERVKHAKSLMDQLFVEQTQLKTVTDKPPEARVKKVPPKPLAKPNRAASQSKQRSQRIERFRNVRAEIYEDDKRNSRIDPEYYLKLRESFERGIPLRSSSTNEGNTKRKSSLQMILEKKEKKMLEELGKLSDLSSSSDDLDLSFENDKENQVHTPSADDAPIMYKPKPFTALVKVQRPGVTRKGQDVPRTAKTYTEMLQDLKKENINPSNKNRSIKSQQRLYGTKRLPGSSKLRGQQSPRHPKPYTQRLQEMKKMSSRPAGMRSRTPIKPPASRLTETVTLGETRRQQVERRGLKAEAKPRVSTPYTERLLQLSGTYTANEAVVSPQPKLGLPYKPKEKLGSTYVNRLKQSTEGVNIKGPYQAVYEPVPRGTYQAYKAPPLRTPSPRHHPYREKRSYEFEDQSVSEASPWSLSDSVKRILGEDDSMAGISASAYPSDDELGDVYLDDQYSEYTLSVNIKELEEIASVGSGSILSFEWDAIDKMVADVK